MNRWARIVWTLALAAAVAWSAGGWMGYGVRSDATLARHTLVVFVALLALVLTHGWVGVYLLTLEALLKRRTAVRSGDGRRLGRARRAGTAGSALAIGAAVAQFTVANALYPGRLSPGAHALTGLVSLLLLIAALALERSALVSAGGIARELSGRG